MKAARKRFPERTKRASTAGWGLVVSLSLAFLLQLSSPASAQDCGCNICHGNPPVVDNKYGGPDGLVTYPLTGSTSAGAHAKHVPSPTGPSMNDVCYKCHVGGMPYSAMCGNNKIQIGFSVNSIGGGAYDGKIVSPPYSFESTTATVITSGGTQQCSNIYCHSNGTGGTKNVAASGTPPLYDPRPVAPNVSPSWTTKGPLACNTCHGYPPSYATDSPKANTHLFSEHLQKCNFCHAATTTDGVTIASTANHDNGIYNVVPDPTATYQGSPVNFTYSYEAGGGHCDSVSCHPGGASEVWGKVNIVVTIYPRNGQCLEVIFDNVTFGNPDPPYTYNWDFGDGTTGQGYPISHIYGTTGPYTVILTGRDKDYHPYSKAISVSPVATNTPPVLAKTMSLKRYTMTITDASYDPDCNTCGHSGNGKIEINWDGVSVWTRDSSVDLCSPTNKVYTYTYPSVAGSKSLRYYVTDNAGAVVSSISSISLPGNITIQGTITHADGSPFAGVPVYLYRAGTTSGALMSATTDGNGNYTLTRAWTFDCYDVRPISGSIVFTPVKQTNICDISSNVNFTAP